jgi:predicted transcriptional regulator of viral defense system
MRKGISEKEIRFISKLELEQKYFFTREDIKDNFKTPNEMNVYIHRLKNKGRIIKLNKNKYFLIPIRAVESKWAEHPFIIIDEIMNSKGYCIVGKASTNYWHLIDQIPSEYEVYNTRIHKNITIFSTRIIFRKKRKMPKGVERTIYSHKFRIATKHEAKEWI